VTRQRAVAGGTLVVAVSALVAWALMAVALTLAAAQGVTG
jgi:hypothetical protein